MQRTDLEIFLPAFMSVYFVLIGIWGLIRGNKKLKLLIVKTDVYRQVHTINKVFKTMFITVLFIVAVYSYFPEYYSLFVPIEFLDIPIINTIGVLILKLSLAWVVIAQLTIDRSAFMIVNEMDVWNYNRLHLYAEKLILTGMLVMFFGLFVTISSGVSVTIFLVGALLYQKLLRFR